MELEQLLERVKVAKGPDRELDADIAAALGFKIEWKQANYTLEMYPVITWPPGREPCPQFTTSIDAALALVERVLPGFQWLIRNDETRGFFANLHEPHKSPNQGHWSAPCWAATPALAILSALLTALIAQKQASVQEG